jgi:hypothetical protein
VGNPEGYELETMSEELFQRLLARLTKEHEDAKEAAAKQAEANRIAAEVAAKLAEEKAKVEAEAQRLRQIVLDNERKEREAQEAAEAKEAAAKQAEANRIAAETAAKLAEEKAKAEAEANRIAAEEKRIARLRVSLSYLADLSKTILDDNWVQKAHEIQCRLSEAEAQDWAEFDMEAEGYIAITREWLAVAVPAAKAAEEAKEKAAAEVEAKRKAELAPDVEKLNAMAADVKALVRDLANRGTAIKALSAQDTVCVFCEKLMRLHQEFENNIAHLSI